MAIEYLRDKKCLVTGAASGIGRATAIAAGEQGANLFLTDIDAGRLEPVAREVRRAGGSVSVLAAADVSDYEAVAALAGEVHGTHGSLDVVMNIAGISTWGAIENLEHHHWQRQVDVNLMGPIHVMECFIPPMIRAGRGGHLVNVASVAGLFGLPWHAAYSAAKFGLRGVSEVLRFDLRRHGIGVSLVCPGAVDTPLVGSLQIVGVDRDALHLRKLERRFRRHAATPEHVAALIIRAIRRDRYLVLTSTDMKVGYWFQRKFALPYELAMRILNDRLNAVVHRR
jgi:NAD(P)-dependent dehydrogenase (short-subunit alcohol dehydrogenase family)